jgi:ferric-dicitrate binding protein FerR (iron transport regulator)
VSAVVGDLNLYFKRPLEVEDTALANRRVTLRLHVDDREQAVSTLAGLLDVHIEAGPDRDTLRD